MAITLDEGGKFLESDSGRELIKEKSNQIITTLRFFEGNIIESDYVIMKDDKKQIYLNRFDSRQIKKGDEDYQIDYDLLIKEGFEEK